MNYSDQQIRDIVDGLFLQYDEDKNGLLERN
jgi:hypothetical protein